MPLTKLQFRPGINRDVTSYTNEGGWRDCDKVRFRLGYPEKVGGWQKYSSSTYLGSARSLHNWVALDGSNYLGIGTHLPSPLPTQLTAQISLTSLLFLVPRAWVAT